jgi:phosphoglycerate dehydrogenase-like enzyme
MSVVRDALRRFLLELLRQAVPVDGIACWHASVATNGGSGAVDSAPDSRAEQTDVRDWMRLQVALIIACSVVALGLQPVRAVDLSAPLSVELGLQEAAHPVSERPGWRSPQKIVVRNLQFPGTEYLQSSAPGVQFVVTETIEAAIEQARDADAVIGWCDARLLQAGPRIRWIQFLYAGVESCVGVPAVRDGTVLLTNMQRVQAPIIAEHATAMVLALARGLDLAVAQQPARTWRPDALLGGGRLRTLKGKTMLIAGLGGIGTEVAQRAHALGMRVVATRASGRERPDFVSYVGGPDELAKLAAEADVIVDALPLTPATQATFDARLFERVKRGALFVNLGRGGTVVTSALIDALRSGALGGAALDVTDPEPLPADHPLWQTPNVIITPHISSESDLGVSRVWEIVRENLRRYVAGSPMLSEVDVSRGY